MKAPIPLFLFLGLIVVRPAWGQPEAQGRFDAWVGFTDKGIFSPEAQAVALQRVEEGFDKRALERRRRRRTLPGLFDVHDLPLNETYVEGVADTGAEVRVRSRWLNGVSVLATREMLLAINDLPFVAEVRDIHPHVPKAERGGRIPPDPDLKQGPPSPSDPTFGWSGPQIRQLNLNSLHAMGFRGSGIRIGVIDTGFLTSHPAFSNPDHPLQVVAQWDFMDNDPVATPGPEDSPIQHEHGSLILGILAANSPGQMVGSAPEAEYVLLKAEDEATEYFLEERWFVAALEFAESRGVDIISSSLVLYEGYGPEAIDGRTSVMAQGWNLATRNGIIGFQGGGNNGHDEDPATHHLLPPSAAPGVITVGAVEGTGGIARFSSDGFRVGDTQKPELLAWGRNTASISPYEEGAFTSSSGTSMATPLLAGAVACVLQAHPDWTLKEIREALFNSGDYFLERGEPDPLFIHGYGIPDVFLASGLGGG